MMSNFLDTMRAIKLRDVAQLDARQVRSEAERFVDEHRPVAGRFARALQRDDVDLAVIAEVKKASPSVGVIREGVTPGGRARVYADAGASAVSVLTEREYFRGDLQDLREASRGLSIPAMRKDFILDPLQIDQAVVHGASAVLLIAGFVERDVLRSLVVHATRRGLGVLMEVFAEEYIPDALDAGARVLGVNARNLETLHVEREKVLRLGPQLAKYCDDGSLDVLVAESGLNTAEHTAQAFNAGYRAALVGEALMRAEDPSALIQAMQNPRRGRV